MWGTCRCRHHDGHRLELLKLARSPKLDETFGLAELRGGHVRLDLGVVVIGTARRQPELQVRRKAQQILRRSVCRAGGSFLDSTEIGGYARSRIRPDCKRTIRMMCLNVVPFKSRNAKITERPSRKYLSEVGQKLGQHLAAHQRQRKRIATLGVYPAA